MEHWLKLGQAITECTNPATARIFIAALAETNINVKDRSRHTA